MDQTSTIALTCAVIALIVLIIGTILTFRKYWIELGLERATVRNTQFGIPGELEEPACCSNSTSNKRSNRQSLVFDNPAVEGDVIVHVDVNPTTNKVNHNDVKQENTAL